MLNYKEEYEKWLGGPFNEDIKAELKNLSEEEIKDRFYKQLNFGTGGLRGKIGAGTNRMNIYTVGKATQGLADFINSHTNKGSAVIAYDSRNMSKEFALESALILAANGVKAYLFEELRPTPELSFAVRHLKATAGIVITASHNPPQYNGYKVYWEDGGQIVPPYDKLIIDKVNSTDFSKIKRISLNEAQNSGLLKVIGKEVDDEYIKAVKSVSLNADLTKSSNLKIVYTPLNGTGLMPVTRVLKELGFNEVYVVPEQEKPDGNFPTLKYPNPEDKAAFDLALKLAKEVDADIALATDPDADRLGVYSKDEKSGEYMRFTGNMSGLLIAEYILSQRKEKGLLPKNSKDGALVTTVVSSKMAYAVAKEYGLTVKEVLTGFKYIGEQIKLFEEAKAKNGGKLGNGAYEYEFGYEESYGCLAGTYARDKDAVSAVTLLCEAAAYYKSKGISLWAQMQNIYKKYGYYVEDLHSVTLEGMEGAEKISALMEKFRNNPPKEFNGEKVLAVRDYLLHTRKAEGKEQKIDLPKSNVIYFELENDGWCCVRPSGTEPKIKFYFGAKGASAEKSQATLEKIKDGILGFCNL